MGPTPVRPDSDIQETGGRITSRWNQYFSALERRLFGAPISGTTANRPTTNLFVGDEYYDQTLGYPVWVHTVSPLVWHNAAGSVV